MRMEPGIKSNMGVKNRRGSVRRTARDCYGAIAVILFLFTSMESSGGILYTDVRYGGIVYDGVGDQSVSYNATISPFSHSHSVALGTWSYDSMHTGTFDALQGSLYSEDILQAQDLGRYAFSTANGGVVLRTDETLWVTFDATMSYTLPGNSTAAAISLSILRYDFPSGDATFLHYQSDGLVAGNGPVSGLAHLEHSMELPPLMGDSIYFVSYDMRLDLSEESFSTGGMLTANGVFSIAYQIVPEPSAIGLVLSLISFVLLPRNSLRIGPLQ